jgi:hypothetical protein
VVAERSGLTVEGLREKKPTTIAKILKGAESARQSSHLELWSVRFRPWNLAATIVLLQLQAHLLKFLLVLQGSQPALGVPSQLCGCNEAGFHRCLMG